MINNMEPAEGALPSLAKDSKGPKGTKGPKYPCDDPSEVRHGDAMGLVPNLDQAKFIALGAQLVIIRDLCHQDLRFKTFYDLTGSGGNAGLAAVFLHQWSKVVSLESSRDKLDAAVISRRLVQGLDPPDMLTRIAKWSIQSGTFKQRDWIDGDVVFLDATILDSLDEGVFCRYLEGRLRALQAGSFVVLNTRCADQLITADSFQLIYRQQINHTGHSRHRGTGGHFTSWLFKTTMHSNDYRVGVFDFSARKASSNCINAAYN